ncbi:MAG: ribonuclease E inhibitor RraB [gamma proteobacterium symbiont of Bathyaustriella thionipta]|nr:ribonuclease E inhibitor RraB [gamma proteobacterium symbiont of Bathyaustriella thionipta]MCU7951758.1 ribonuclease E inhibitor RraB [gamma proteobacterium symbiont of Bathyaustriella thionipta]MCU7954527.1 ribonuclease E inhibitor RraB [gamma proteobacterium symbiont of Bathyaustriella thionipta]MCU7958361.1 ribonuclease E inhibitor RraB [gamma proteobacterium symbiont of Bathyaustriella thionipta]
MITIYDIEQLFEKMRKAGWNMEQQLAWGYFFKDKNKEPLEKMAIELEQQGYEVVDINQSYPDKLYWLQVEKIEQHSVDSLNKRNQAFYHLAEKMNIHTYDGMDVSPVDIF